MTHLVILCEGVTEKRVLQSFLRPYWQVRFRTVEIQSYDGNHDLRVNFKRDAERQLAEDPETSVLCLVDLFQEPFGLYQPANMTVEEGFKLVRDRMYREVNSRFHLRFGAFPVVMEIETWLLADPVVQQRLGETTVHPEKIDHPYGHLEKIYRSKKDRYGKIVNGVTLFGVATAARVYADECPHFNQLVDWIANRPIAAPDPLSQAVARKKAEWEDQRNEKYDRFLKMEREITTESELEEAIKAETEYTAFVATYDDIFK